MTVEVKPVEAPKQLSRAEREDMLIKKAQQEQEAVKSAASETEEAPAEAEEAPAEAEDATKGAPKEEKSIGDDEVLEHIRKRYNREINSLDELLEAREEKTEIPENLKALWQYQQETGRGIDDFVKLQRDYTSIDDDSLLAEYYLATEKAFDINEAKERIELDYGFDDDVDEERTIKKRKLERKAEINKARKFFKEQQEKYKAPLESREQPSGELEEFKAYKERTATHAEKAQKRSEWFTKKTDEIFNPELKGFEYNVGDKTVTYLPGKVDEVKKAQSDVTNFINKFVDENGFLSKPKEYHKALAVAMNPDDFARKFYEQGKADAIEEQSAKDANIDMGVRRSPEVAKKGPITVKPMSQPTGGRLRVRSKNKK